MSLAILHPLLLLHISDHQTRVKGPVGGGILGVYEPDSKTYALFLGFEIDTTDGLQERLALFREVYPQLELLGSYQTADHDTIDLPTKVEPVTLRVNATHNAFVQGKQIKTEVKPTPFEEIGLNTIAAADTSQKSATQLANDAKAGLDTFHARIANIQTFLRTLASRRPTPVEYNKLRRINELNTQLALLQTDLDPSPRLIDLTLLFHAIRKLDPRVPATFYTYVPNIDVAQSLLRTVHSVESSFNKRHKYDWVFAYYADHEMSPELRARLQKLCSGQVHFERISSPHYDVPESIDQGKLHQALRQSASASPCSKFLQYKLKNRFQTYGFQFLPIMRNYRYYCNVEVGSQLACDVEDDFFRHMHSNQLVYGFASAPVESRTLTKSLVPAFEQFLGLLPYNETEVLPFVYENEYTQCNFDSNFEVVDLEFFRSRDYERLFHYLDNTNGFFLERWTDYNVKTLAVALFVPASKIFWLPNTGVSGLLNRNTCPLDKDVRIRNRCACDPAKDFAFSPQSGLRRLFHVLNWDLPESVPPTTANELAPKFRTPVNKLEAYPWTFEYMKSDLWFREQFMGKPRHKRDTTS
ncbi:hypothetical protein KL939_001148 [Ogataea angusta]|nr:hypothetical protein KL939_001148 [Ogataea angusta]